MGNSIIISIQKVFALSGLLLFTTLAYSQENVNLNFTVGLNSFSYFNDGITVFDDSWEGKFIQTQIITPVIGIQAHLPSAKLSLTGSYYMAPVTSPYGNLEPELFDNKSVLSLDIDYHSRSGRFGLILSSRNYGQAAFVSTMPGQSTQFGVGFKYGFPIDGFQIELRNEMLLVIGNNTSFFDPVVLFSPAVSWNIRANYMIPMNYSDSSSLQEHKGSLLSSHLSFFGGSSISGNPNYKFSTENRLTNMNFIFGLEYYWNKLSTSLVFKRSQSLEFDLTSYIFEGYIQNNHLGLSYWIPIKSDKIMKIDLSHNWSFNRKTQTKINMEFREDNPLSDVPIKIGDYTNRSWAIGIRYPLTRASDIFAQFDYFYRTDKYSAEGIAPNSLQLGVLFYLRK